jgi:ABC-type glycerol-3-phosphate transport system substrate-binding protein
MVVAVVLLLALVASACGEEPSSPVSFVDGPIIVDAQEDDEREDQDLKGTIALVEGCVIMISEDVEEPFGVEWPPGTTWDEAANAVVLPDGRPVNIGEFIVGGGGGHGLDDKSRVTPEVRAALEECGIHWVLHLWGGIVTGEAAIEYPGN